MTNYWVNDYTIIIHDRLLTLQMARVEIEDQFSQLIEMSLNILAHLVIICSSFETGNY